MSEGMTDKWIDKCIVDGDLKKLYLKNGIRLMGKIIDQDAYSLLISDPTGSETLVYKDMVSTIVRRPEHAK